MAKYYRDPLKRAITNAADAIRRQVGTLEGSQWIVPKDYLSKREQLYARVKELTEQGAALTTAAKRAIKEISTFVVEAIDKPWMKREAKTYQGAIGWSLEETLKERNRASRAIRQSEEYAERRAIKAGFVGMRLKAETPAQESFIGQYEPMAILTRRTPEQRARARADGARKGASKSMTSAGVDPLVRRIVEMALAKMSTAQLNDISNAADLQAIYDSDRQKVIPIVGDVVKYAKDLAGFNISAKAMDILLNYQRSPSSLDVIMIDDDGNKYMPRDVLNEEFPNV